ncbi:MAG TPA: toll/interleukin-1 receptor domain-containing protein [Nannocystis exedens]|nr:toll/interleukin-1 receptor domain-containing protein [Nannocystis exedens]
MSLSIFISHSFDHPDKLMRIQEFLRGRGIRHVDHSIPVWSPYRGPDVQAEIARRIKRCDRVIVILTEGIHRSRWIHQEVEWARRYGKPVIAAWPHGEAGSPIPKVVADADPSLIGWRATSLEKALRLEEVGRYRAFDLAENADRAHVITQIAGAAAVLSLLVVGHDVLRLRQLRADLQASGVAVAVSRNQHPVIADLAVGAVLGGLAGYIIGDIFGLTRDLPRLLGLSGAVLGGAYNVHRRVSLEIAELGPLAELRVWPLKSAPA